MAKGRLGQENERNAVKGSNGKGREGERDGQRQQRGRRYLHGVFFRQLRLVTTQGDIPAMGLTLFPVMFRRRHAPVACAPCDTPAGCMIPRQMHIPMRGQTHVHLAADAEKQGEKSHSDEAKAQSRHGLYQYQEEGEVGVVVYPSVKKNSTCNLHIYPVFGY